MNKQNKITGSPPEGFQRFTFIAEKELVDYLRSYSRKSRIRIMDMVNDAIKQYIKNNHKRG